MNENWTKFIEMYLQGELSQEDTAKLQAELDRNPEMRQSLELQKQIHEAAKRSGERQLIKTVGKSYRFQRTVKTSIISVIAATAIATLGYFAVQAFEKNRKSDAKGSEAVVEGKYQKLDKEAELDNLPIAYFEHDGSDATFLSPKGILISVPKKTFLLNGKPYNGKAILQFQEALDASDIIKAGLSTTSGDRLLETQGMFQLKAFTPDGKQLTVNDKDGIYLQVPVDENKKGMMLFNGVKTAEGQIDWQNPKPIEKLPVQANMLDLDLYPPGYEAKLDELKWKKGKKQRDSLYLSFEESKSIIEKSTFKVGHASIFCNQKFGNNVLGSSITTPEMELFENLKISILFNSKSEGIIKVNGSMHPELTVALRKSDSILLQYKNPHIIIKNISSFVGRTEYRTVFFESEYTFKLLNQNIPDFIAAIDFSHLNSFKKTSNFWFGLNFNPTMDIAESSLLPPSKVLAIWKKDFNKTILATRDFEKRMKAIHGACNEKVFDVYANQLNKSLWELDEQVVKMGYSNFQAFADERVGALKQDNVHMNILRQFYESNVSRLKDLAKKDQAFQKALEINWDRKVTQERKEELQRTTKRVAKVFNDEYQLNLKNVLKQMGPTVGLAIHGGGTIYNIDKYVMDATIARKSAVITDPITGKTAKITYNPFKATIANAQNYGKLFLYLLPQGLTSFQRINPSNGKFDYALNDAIQYDAIFVGLNEGGYFISEHKKLKGGDLGVISLQSVSEKEFEHIVEKLSQNRLKTSTQSSDMSQELNWLKLEKQDYQEQKIRQQNAAFRRMIGSVIYPCSSESDNTDIENPFF